MKSIPKELSDKITEIHSWMLDGDQQKVAQISGHHEGHVSRMFNKRKSPSKKFLEAAIQVMNENKRRFEIEPSMKVAS